MLLNPVGKSVPDASLRPRPGRQHNSPVVITRFLFASRSGCRRRGWRGRRRATAIGAAGARALVARLRMALLRCRSGASVYKQATLAGRVFVPPRVDHRPRLVHQFFQRLKLLVDTGEANVRHLVEPPQPVRHQLPHHRRLDFAVVGVEDFVLDLVGDAEQFALRHRPLEAGALQAGEDLGLVPGDAAAVLLDHHQSYGLLDALVGGEALGAVVALAAPTDGPAALAGAGVDDLKALLVGVAERAAHPASKSIAARPRTQSQSVSRRTNANSPKPRKLPHCVSGTTAATESRLLTRPPPRINLAGLWPTPAIQRPHPSPRLRPRPVPSLRNRS